jgi:hypothetical protein
VLLDSVFFQLLLLTGETLESYSENSEERLVFGFASPWKDKDGNPEQCLVAEGDALCIYMDAGKEEVYRINGAAFARNYRLIPPPDVPAAFQAQLEEIQASKAILQTDGQRLEQEEARVLSKLAVLVEYVPLQCSYPSIFTFLLG